MFPAMDSATRREREKTNPTGLHPDLPRQTLPPSVRRSQTKPIRFLGLPRQSQRLLSEARRVGLALPSPLDRQGKPCPTRRNQCHAIVNRCRQSQRLLSPVPRQTQSLDRPATPGSPRGTQPRRFSIGLADQDKPNHRENFHQFDGLATSAIGPRALPVPSNFTAEGPVRTHFFRRPGRIPLNPVSKGIPGEGSRSPWRDDFPGSESPPRPRTWSPMPSLSVRQFTPNPIPILTGFAVQSGSKRPSKAPKRGRNSPIFGRNGSKIDQNRRKTGLRNPLCTTNHKGAGVYERTTTPITGLAMLPDSTILRKQPIFRVHAIIDAGNHSERGGRGAEAKSIPDIIPPPYKGES